MKRLIFPVIVILCLCLAFAYLYKHDFLRTPEQTSKQVPKQTQEQGSQDVQQNLDKKKIVDSVHFKSAKEGKVDGIEFAIGDKKDDVLNKWGTPEFTDVFEGYSYISYDNAAFFYDEAGTIREIAFNGDFNTYGIASGMKPAEVKKILGLPSSEGVYEQAEGWAMEYYLGEYSVLFISEGQDSPVTSGILQTADSNSSPE